MDDAGFISAMIDEIGTLFNVDEKRIYATGISNGGMMAYRLACELSDKIAAAAAVAPPAVPQDCAPECSISIMHIHGTADPCCPYDGGPGGCLLDTTSMFTAMSARDMVDYWLEWHAITTVPTTIYQHGTAACLGYTNGDIEVELCLTWSWAAHFF